MAYFRIRSARRRSWPPIPVSGAGALLSHITVPKATSAKQVAEAILYVQQVAAHHGVRCQIPIHALVETNRRGNTWHNSNPQARSSAPR